MNIFTAMCYQVDYWSATLKLQFNLISFGYLSLSEVLSKFNFAAAPTLIRCIGIVKPALLLFWHSWIIWSILLCCCLHTAILSCESCFAAVSTLLHHMVNTVLLPSLHCYIIWWILFCCCHTTTLYGESCFADVSTLLRYPVNPSFLLYPHCHIVWWILLCCCLHIVTMYGESCFKFTSSIQLAF